MTPTAAARAPQASTPSLRDRLKDPSLLRDRCYIDGAWVGTPVNPVTNPVNGVELAKVPKLGTAEATQAVEAAERAFPAWARLTAKQRSNILRKWFDLIIANREDLALILTSEQGKPLAEALGEVDIGGAYVEFFAEEARRVYGETIPTQRPDARLLAIRQPIGVCGAITPWNFPCSMITRKVSPALAAGCTVVLKPANETPLTALALVALAEKAGVPKGVFNILTGNSSAIGKVLCEHPAVRFVGFTGSTEVGKILYQQSAVGVKKLGLELGGNAPFVVFDDADIDAAVDGAMVSKYRNMGQTCVCANRIYAQDGIYDQFVEKLSKKVAAMKIGDGTEAGRDTGPADQHGRDRQGRKAYRGCGQGWRENRHRGKAPFARRYLLRADGAVQRRTRRAGVAGRNFWAPGAGVPFQGRGRRDRDVQQFAVRACLLFLFARSRPGLAGGRGAGVRHGRRQHRLDHHRGSTLRRGQGVQASAARARITAWKNMSRSNT